MGSQPEAKNDIRLSKSCSHLLDKSPTKSSEIQPRHRGRSLPYVNVDDFDYNQKDSRQCLCERMNDQKSEYRQRSYSMFCRKGRVKKKTKVVRFADTLGLDTAVMVREFDSNVLPEVPLRLLSDPLDPDRRSEPLEESLPLTFKFNFSPRDTAVLEAVARRQHLCLYKIHVSENLLSGLVLVEDRGSQDKRMFARWTHDRWVSQKDTYSYCCSKYSHDMDQFSFQIIIPAAAMAFGGVVELALCFQCNSGEFWDNNNGENYRFVRTLCPFSN